MNKDYYVYKEYDDNGEELIKVTEVFTNIDDLFKKIRKRQKFYNSFWNTRTIKIDIIKNRKNEENKNE